MRYSVDLQEDFIDEASVATARVLSFQSSSLYSAEFEAPKADGFPADSDTAFSQQVFNIALTEVETTVESDRIADAVGWELVGIVSIQPPIPAILVP